MRIRSVYLKPLGILSRRNGTTDPEEVNRFIREGLQREGLWPFNDDA